MKLKDLTDIPLAPEHCVRNFGKTLIVAPHADDESLGCGGVVSLLTKFGNEVYILLLSDGTLSHPNSKKYPAEKLRELREREFVNACEILGVPAENLIFFRLKDRSVPNIDNQDYNLTVDRIKALITELEPQNVFVPWRRDPHPDHRAAYQLTRNAVGNSVRFLEYPIWLKELGNDVDDPEEGEIMPFRLDISSVLEQKREAISAHISQTTNFIDDDPEAFMLSREMLQDFDQPFELFFISTQ